jgi:hypothetical protein
MKAKKNKRERSQQMREVSEGLCDVLGMTQWRQQHPKASLREIEEAVDERINQLRAQLIEDVVLMGQTQAWTQQPQGERPRCATCDQPLSMRGEQTRFLQTTGGEAIKLRRPYGTCPQCGEGFFPLDEQLGLRSRGVTPRAEETLARLASWMPFEPARKLLKDVLGVQVSKATARRATLAAGAAALAVQEEEAKCLKKALPQAPRGAPKQAMSADGAMVPLVGGVWGEGKHAGAWRGDAQQARRDLYASLSPLFRGWRMWAALRRRRWWRPIGAGWKRRMRYVRSKMGPSGSQEWWTTTAPTRCASWILSMPPSISARWAKRLAGPAAPYQRTGWQNSCMNSSTMAPSRCWLTCGGWWGSIPR